MPWTLLVVSLHIYRKCSKPKPSENCTWLCQQVVFLNGTDVILNVKGYGRTATDIRCGVMGTFLSLLTPPSTRHRMVITDSLWSGAEHTQLILASVVLLRNHVEATVWNVPYTESFQSDQI